MCIERPFMVGHLILFLLNSLIFCIASILGVVSIRELAVFAIPQDTARSDINRVVFKYSLFCLGLSLSLGLSFSFSSRFVSSLLLTIEACFPKSDVSCSSFGSYSPTFRNPFVP